MLNSLEESFPGLVTGGYRITSPKDKRYNCIAHAAGDSERWWWPLPPDVDSEARDLVKDLAISAQLADVQRILPQTPGNPCLRPTECRHGFDGHQPVGHVMHDMRRCAGGEVLP